MTTRSTTALGFVIAAGLVTSACRSPKPQPRRQARPTVTAQKPPTAKLIEFCDQKIPVNQTYISCGWSQAKPHDARELRRFPRLRFLELRGQVANLEALRELPLVMLRIEGASLASLEFLRGHQTLEYLDVYDRDSLTALGPVHTIANLRRLEVRALVKHSDNAEVRKLADLDRLTALVLLGNFSLEAISHLTRLEMLGLHYSNSTSDLTPLTRLSRLEALELSGGHVATLAPLAQLPALRTLKLHKVHISRVGPLPNIRSLTWRGDIYPSQLATMTQLQSLDLSGSTFSPGLGALSELAKLQNLYKLDLSKTKLADLTPIAGMRRLEELDVSRTRIETLAPLAKLSRLRSLNATTTLLTDIAPLTGLRRLETLKVGDNQLRSLEPLAKMTQLRSLSLSAAGVTDLTPLAGLRHLQHLGLSSNPIRSLEPLSSLVRLRSLQIDDTEIVDLSPVARMTALERISIRLNDGITSVEPLARLPRLRDVSIHNTSVTDLSPIAHLEQNNHQSIEDQRYGKLLDEVFDEAMSHPYPEVFLEQRLEQRTRR